MTIINLMRVFKIQGGFAPILLLFIVALAVIAVLYYGKSQISIPSPTPESQLTLTLESPNEKTLVADDQVLVKGKTLPNTTVVLYNETDELVLESDTEGFFQTLLQVGKGGNLLTVTAFGDDGSEKTLNVELAYTP